MGIDESNSALAGGHTLRKFLCCGMPLGLLVFFCRFDSVTLCKWVDAFVQSCANLASTLCYHWMVADRGKQQVLVFLTGLWFLRASNVECEVSL